MWYGCAGEDEVCGYVHMSAPLSSIFLLYSSGQPTDPLVFAPPTPLPVHTPRVPLHNNTPHYRCCVSTDTPAKISNHAKDLSSDRVSGSYCSGQVCVCVCVCVCLSVCGGGLGLSDVCTVYSLQYSHSVLKQLYVAVRRGALCCSERPAACVHNSLKETHTHTQ